MGKRMRALAVRLNDRDVYVTYHAIRRFRTRVEGVHPKHAPNRIRDMLAESRPIASKVSDGRHYIAHPKCVFVMKTNGVIVTVLPPQENSMRLADSTKGLRRSKKSRDYRDSIRRTKTKRRYRRTNQPPRSPPQEPKE